MSSQNTCATIQEIFKNARLFFSKQEWFRLVTCLLVYYCMKNGPDPKTLLPNCILHYYHARCELLYRNKINTCDFDIQTFDIGFIIFMSKQLWWMCMKQNPSEIRTFDRCVCYKTLITTNIKVFKIEWRKFTIKKY